MPNPAIVFVSLSDVINNNPKLEPLFYAASPKTIKYGDKPPLLNGTYQEIPTDEFAKSKGMEWSEALYSLPEIRDILWKDKSYSKQARADLEYRLHNPLNSLVICKINDKVGDGVFLDKNADPLPQGTILGVYAGDLHDSLLKVQANMTGESIDATSKLGAKFHIDPHNQYTMAADPDEKKQSIISEHFYHPKVGADKRGNFMRFLQDLPNIPELETAGLTKLEASNIASENVVVIPIIYYGCTTSLFVCMRDILPGEQLGFSYGQSNWPSGMNRCVFNKNGEEIGHFDESGKVLLDIDYEPTIKMALPSIDIDAMLKKFNLIVNSPKYDTFDYKSRFCSNVNLALDVWTNRFDSKSGEHSYLINMKNQFIQASDTDVAFLILKDAFKSLDGKTFKDELSILKREIIFHMNKYNEGKKMPMTLDNSQNFSNNSFNFKK